MKIAIGSDHAGLFYKKKIKLSLLQNQYEVFDFGTHTNQSVDYPDFIHPLSYYVENQNAKFGIIICGSGNGVAITANKYRNIRAAVAWNQEVALLAREHNNANILSIPARFINQILALEIVYIFLNGKFQGGRHQIRINKISNIIAK